MTTFGLRAARAQAFGAFERGDFLRAFHLGSDLARSSRVDPPLRELLGISAARTGRLEVAERHLKRAVKHDPTKPQLHQALAEMYGRQGRFDEALAHYDRVLRIAPSSPQAIGGKASVLEWRGDREAALALLQPYVDQGTETPLMAIVHSSAQQAEGRHAESVDVILRHLGRCGGADAEARRLLCGLAARAFEKAEDYDKAFEAFSMSNRSIARPFDPDAYVKEVDILIGTFSRENLSILPRASVRSELPVFVASMPRAGSTLVEQIIHAHPLAFGAGEIRELDEIVKSLPVRLESLQAYPACLGDFTLEHADEVCRSYLRNLRTYDRNAARITNKHLRNYRHLGMVALLCPGARVIHCKRHPLDNCFSIFMASMNPADAPWASDLEHIGIAFRQYERLMAHWRDVLDLDILDVQYEAIVAEPDTWIRRIIDFCGLPWDERCLRYYEADRDVMTLSYDQVRRPIYRTAVERYRKYEAFLAPLKRALASNSRERR